jgi:H+/Cl- antiporter ClcA
LISKIKSISEKIIEFYISSEIFRYISHILLSVALGILAGAGGILFHSLLEFMRVIFEQDSIKNISGLGEYYIILVPVVGALITSTMTYLSPQLARQQGVVTVIKAIIVKKWSYPAEGNHLSSLRSHNIHRYRCSPGT